MSKQFFGLVGVEMFGGKKTIDRPEGGGSPYETRGSTDGKNRHSK